jgi:hypothetical protein
MVGVNAWLVHTVEEVEVVHTLIYVVLYPFLYRSAIQIRSVLKHRRTGTAIATTG